MSVGKGEGGGNESHCSPSVFLLFKADPSCLYDGWWPIWSGRLVLGITVDWEPRAVRSETAIVPSALQAGPPGASTLPRWKGGTINQSVCGTMLSYAIHLCPQSLVEDGARGDGKPRVEEVQVPGGTKSGNAARHQVFCQPSGPITQRSEDTVSTGTTREAIPIVCYQTTTGLM